MSLFDRIFGGRKKDEPQRMLPEYKALTAYQPVFTSFSGQLYETELIRSAINVRATHISKLKVDFYGHGAEALSKRLTRPNGFQTWSQFLYRVIDELREHLELVVRLEARQYTAGVVIVEKLASELHVELVAEFGDALLDMFGLDLEIFLRVEPVFHNGIQI